MKIAAKATAVSKAAWGLLKDSYNAWSEDRAPTMGAAISYYTLFSVAPLLVIAIAIAGLVFGRDAAEGRIVEQINGLVGQKGAEAIQMMVQNAWRPGTGTIATILGVATLILGASGVFVQLQDSLNIIWRVRPKPGQGLWLFIRTRLVSFAAMLGIGFLLLVSLLISAALSAFGTWLGGWLTARFYIFQIVNNLVSLGVVTLLFALLFKFLPDTRMSWKDVWIGAAVTAVLFTAGKYLVGLYLGRSSVASAYGAAGTVVIVLLWMYYAAQILLFGAEFTHVYASRYGSRSAPAAVTTQLKGPLAAE